MLEPPHFALGLKLPKEIYYPGYDKSVSQSELGVVFARWASSFHQPHSDLPNDVETISRQPAMHDMVEPEARFLPTVLQIDPQELAGWFEPGVIERSGRCVNTVDLGVWRENAERALFDCPGDSVLRHVGVLVLWGDMTVPLAVYTISNLSERLQERECNSRRIRRGRIVKVHEGNHFVSLNTPSQQSRR